MTYFLLPKTQSNFLYEERTLPVSHSLEFYISTFPKTCHLNKLIIPELLQLYNIEDSSILHVGENDNGLKFMLLVNNSNMDLSVLSKQQQNGTYISRMENSTSAESIQYLYKLCSSYKQVYLCKPLTDCSRSSTKYVIAIHFCKMPDLNNLKIPYYFRMKLSEINSIFGQTQLEYLRN
jgi:hypothetical protein